MLVAALVFLFVNTMCIAILSYTNQVMRNRAITAAADHSLLLDPSGGRLDDDLQLTLKALDSTYPYNFKPNLSVMIPLQGFISLGCFVACYYLFKEDSWLVYASSMAILGSLALLDGFSTWLPRHYSITLIAAFIGLAAYGISANDLTLTQAIIGPVFAWLICWLANVVCAAINRAPAIADGDTYYLMAIGALLGPDVSVAILLAVFIQTILIKTRLLTTPQDTEKHAPFGPAIFSAFILILLTF